MTALTGFSVAVAVIYNLVSDVVGGLEVVVLEARKPGLVIGRHGSTLNDLKKEIGWAPKLSKESTRASVPGTAPTRRNPCLRKTCPAPDSRPLAE